MQPTIKDIAMIAGVSRGTVDRVINKRGKVSPDAEEKIKNAMQSLNYKKNKVGIALAASKKKIIIGFLLPSVNNPFYIKVKAGIQKAREEFSDYAMSIIVKEVKGYSVTSHLQAINELVDEGAEFLCLATIEDESVKALLSELIERGIRIITVNSDLKGVKRICYVGCDYQKSGETAAGVVNLMSSNDDKILVVTGSSKMYGHNTRVDGFCTKLEQAKVIGMVEGEDDDDICFRLVKSFIEQNKSVSTIYVATAGVDGVVKAIAQSKINAKIVCHDDTDNIKALIKESIVSATICQQPFEQGYMPIKIILDLHLEGRMPQNDKIYTNAVIKLRQNI